MNDRQLFFRHVAQTSPSPMGLDIQRAEGIHLYDREGKSYLDMVSGIGPSLLGHQHPAITKALHAQTDAYLHTLVYGEFILSPQTRLAAALTDRLPSSLDNVYFLSTGTEATEVAMKLAKRYTGRAEIIAIRDSYHGSTQGALSLMSDAYFTDKFRPLLPGIRFMDWNDSGQIDIITDHTAAVIMEVVKAETGIHLPDPAFLAAVRQRCHETGTLLVFDEIQSAYARTGTLFAFERYGVVPDVLLLGKSFGGGMPLAACIANRDIMSSLSDNPVLGHITTFGGHPLACAAGLATLDTLVNEPWMEQIPAKEGIFLEKLKHPAIKEVRSAGLWLAIELENEQILQKTLHLCLSRGLIADWFLFNAKAMRIAPPVCITEEQIHAACDIILTSLSDI
jgi:acetylornithine/succinyldiaminopimelate/putrescine aminotransferase